jgi:TolB protein
VRTTEGGRKRDLYIVNADGTGQKQLTNGIIIEGTTQWSPDGASVLLQAGVEGISNVVVVQIGEDNAGSTPHSLTSDIGKDSAYPAWSPDGNRIAFQSKRDGDLFQVYVMDADGNNKRRLSDGAGFAGMPTWSPDGQSIAYVSGQQQTTGSQRELYTVPVDGGAPRKLTSLGSSLSDPEWSPDGKSIAVLQAMSDRQTNLLLVDAQTGEHRSLVQGGIMRDPHFSPSGDEVVYYNVTPEEGSNVYVVNVGDGQVRNLTQGPGDDYQAIWSPDGTMLAWSSKPGGGQYRIVSANADGTAQRTLTSGEGDDYQPAWGLRK